MLRAQGRLRCAVRPARQSDGSLRSQDNSISLSGKRLQLPPSRRWAWRPTRRATPSSTRKTTARAAAHRHYPRHPDRLQVFLHPAAGGHGPSQPISVFTGYPVVFPDHVFQLIPLRWSSTPPTGPAHDWKTGSFNMTMSFRRRKVLKAAALTYGGPADVRLQAAALCAHLCGPATADGGTTDGRPGRRPCGPDVLSE